MLSKFSLNAIYMDSDNLLFCKIQLLGIWGLGFFKFIVFGSP